MYCVALEGEWVTRDDGTVKGREGGRKERSVSYIIDNIQLISQCLYI